MLQTGSYDQNLQFSMLSPPTFSKPLPDTPVFSQPLPDTLSGPPPLKCLPDYPATNPNSLTEDPFSYPSASLSLSDDPDGNDMQVDWPPSSTMPSETNSAIASETNSVVEEDWPPSSTMPSETNSAAVSESDLLFPSSIKARKQTGLLDFFSRMPAKEVHEKWGKRKRENEDRDREEHAKLKQKEEAEKIQKLEKRRANNRVSQARRRERLTREKDKNSLLGDQGPNSSVSLFIALSDHYSQSNRWFLYLISTSHHDVRLLLLHVPSSLLLQYSNRRKRRMLESLSNLQNVIPPRANISTGSHLYSGQLLPRWSESRVESQTSVRLFGYSKAEMYGFSSSPISGSVTGETRHSQTKLFGLKKLCGMFRRDTSQVVIKPATMYL
jgi:hypothetical protein